MKRTFVLLLFILISGVSVKAQIKQKLLGVTVTPGVTLIYMEDAAFGMSGGIHYSQTMNRRFGFSTGLNYMQLFRKAVPNNEDSYKLGFHTLELPVLLSFNLDYNPEQRTKTFLLLGYSPGYIIAGRNISFEERKLYPGPRPPYDGIETDKVHYMPDLDRFIHVFNIGIEARSPISEDYVFSAGPMLKFSNIYDNSSKYVYNIGLSLKLSRVM